MATPSTVLSPAARLPVELVEMICNELAVLEQHVCRAGSSRWYTESQSAALAAAARVCRKWVRPAQTALLRSLYFYSADDCIHFLDAMKHNARLLGVPRAVDFDIVRHRMDEQPLDLGKHIATILDKCCNLAFVRIYSEWSIISPGFEYAIRNLHHLPTFIYEANPGDERSRWLNESVHQLPSQVRVVGLHDEAVDMRVVFDLPFHLDLLEYRYMGAWSDALLRNLDKLLETGDRPYRVSRLNLYADSYVYHGDVDDEVIKHYTDSFAARGAVFQLMDMDWE